MIDTSTLESLKSLEAPYLKGDYESVKTELIKLKPKIGDGLFHYNFGTILAKEGSLGIARYHFEKSSKEGFSSTGLKNNLDLVKETLQPSDLKSSSHFSDNLAYYSFSIPLSYYLTISLLFILSIVILKRLKKLKSNLILGSLLLVSLTPWAYSEFCLKKKDLAISFSEISIYEGPSKIFPEKRKLKEGSRVIVGMRQDGWYFIDSPIYLSGWVDGKQLGLY